MVDSLLVLGQVNPAANTLTTLYTVPAATTATISSLIVCNLSANTNSFRVSIAVNGAADDLKQYIYYNLPMNATDTFIATIGISLGSGDVVRVWSFDNNLAFSLYGVQLT